MRSITLYNKTSTGKTKVLGITVDGDTLTTRWWQESDGKRSKIQKTSEKGKAKNVGKTNEITPEQNAEDLYDRKVKKKMDEGYVEDLDALLAEPENDPWSLPKKFAPSKPATKITDAKLKALIERNDCIVTAKRDGQRAFIFHMPDDSIRIMSRRMEDYTEHVPHLVKTIKNLEMPPGTILDVELVAFKHKDDYDYVGSILRSKPNKAIAKQKENGYLYIYAFDILYCGGENITGLPYHDRWFRLSCSTNEDEYFLVTSLIYPNNIDDVKKMLKEYHEDGGEGLVIWDASAPTRVRYDGKPDRKGGAFKMKPVYEDDFYVRGYELGKGKFAGVVGALFIFQKDKDGNEIAWGKCGGFAGDSIIRRKLFDMDLDSGKLVIEVEYSKRNKDGLRFPVMQRVRTDKMAEECIWLGEN